jgi:hypothetical protein
MLSPAWLPLPDLSGDALAAAFGSSMDLNRQATCAACTGLFFHFWRGAGLPSSYYNVAIGLNYEQEAAASVG